MNPVRLVALLLMAVPVTAAIAAPGPDPELRSLAARAQFDLADTLVQLASSA